MTRRQRMRWLGEQAGWLIGSVLAVLLALPLLALLPLFRAIDRLEGWLDE